METTKSARKNTSDQASSCDLSEQLRAATKGNRIRAENTPQMLSYQKGQITLQQYKVLLCSFYEIYKVMEEELDRRASHPAVAPIYFPQELARLESLERDLEHFFGPDWRQKVIVPAATCRYQQRLRQIGNESPELLVAHAYTRYIGDLSGGQILAKVIQKTLRLSNKEGYSFYNFPRVSSPERFKQLFRSRMNCIELTEEQRAALVQEAVDAFELNIQVFHDLENMLNVTNETAAQSDSSIGKPSLFTSGSLLRISVGLCVALTTVGLGFYAL